MPSVDFQFASLVRIIGLDLNHFCVSVHNSRGGLDRPRAAVHIDGGAAQDARPRGALQGRHPRVRQQAGEIFLPAAKLSGLRERFCLRCMYVCMSVPFISFLICLSLVSYYMDIWITDVNFGKMFI